MSENPQWRTKVFHIGRWLVIASAVDLLFAWARTPHLMRTRSFNELAAWIFGDLFISLAALVLLLLARGRRRWVFLVAVLIELFFWYDFAAMAAQLFG